MKAKKKPKGTKARVQVYKRRLAYIGTAITAAILVAIIAVSSFLIYSYLHSSPDQTNNPTSTPKAAIVDHLSFAAPNQAFIQTATNTLEKAVTETMKIVGPDPTDNSILLYYPREVGDQTIEGITANPKTNP
jgi:hypothetical protein